MISKGSLYVKNIGQLLKAKLQQKQSENSLYSYRAFSRDLNISVSSLSDYCNNKKVPSINKIQAICKKLGLSEDETRPYVTLVADLQFDPNLLAKFPEINVADLTQDLKVIHSDIYHYAYLGLKRLPNFRDDICWIAERLSTSKEHVSEIINRLDRCKLVFENENVAFKISTIEDSLSLHSNVSKILTDKFSNCDPNNLIHSFMILNLSTSKIPEIKQFIESQRRELATRIEQYDTPDAVYLLTLNLVPLTT